MPNYDCFNGDADGILALHQLRLAEPMDALLLTGVKRDTQLLSRIEGQAGDSITALDIGLKQNRKAAERLLALGAHIRWFDHHAPGEPLQHPNFTALIDTSPDVCSALLVDRHLAGRHRPWAIAAAFGDGLPEVANRLAQELGLTPAQVRALQELGECLNYNAYGETEADLHCRPMDVYADLKNYTDPWRYCAESPAFTRIAAGFADDWAQAGKLVPVLDQPHAAAYLLPDAAWARRVSGVWASRLASQDASRAQAIITHATDGQHYRVSVRVPAGLGCTAEALCSQFPSGGGRATAGGIDALPIGDIDRFLRLLSGTGNG